MTNTPTEQSLPQIFSEDLFNGGTAASQRSARKRLLPEQICFAGATLVGVGAGLYGGTALSIAAGAAGGIMAGVFAGAAILLAKVYQTLD